MFKYTYGRYVPARHIRYWARHPNLFYQHRAAVLTKYSPEEIKRYIDEGYANALSLILTEEEKNAITPR